MPCHTSAPGLVPVRRPCPPGAPQSLFASGRTLLRTAWTPLGGSLRPPSAGGNRDVPQFKKNRGATEREGLCWWFRPAECKQHRPVDGPPGGGAPTVGGANVTCPQPTDGSAEVGGGVGSDCSSGGGGMFWNPTAGGGTACRCASPQGRSSQGGSKPQRCMSLSRDPCTQDPAA